MIIVLKQSANSSDVEELSQVLLSHHITINKNIGVHTIVLGLIGDTSQLDIDQLSANPCVDQIKRIQEPYKKANRKFHPEDTVIKIGDCVFGGSNIPVIAGPCSVESEEQMIEIATKVKQAGAKMLRGGAFKPRTSPYAFQGLRAEGLPLLQKAKEVTGLPIVTEIMSIHHLELFEEVDLIQVGTRNMQNFELLRALGKLHKPVMLKRGMANTLEEWLMSAEYIMSGGNEQVILCERGIRTFEDYTRNTLDISAVPVLKRLSHLPVIVDPSHASGITWLVEPLSGAAIAAGVDGLMIEVHNNPPKALSDGAQSITPQVFKDMMPHLQQVAKAMGRSVI